MPTGVAGCARHLRLRIIGAKSLLSSISSLSPRWRSGAPPCSWLNVLARVGEIDRRTETADSGKVKKGCFFSTYVITPRFGGLPGHTGPIAISEFKMPGTRRK